MSFPFPVMIYAAGLGTRMGELTRDCPKPLLRVGDTTLLDHALDLCGAAGARRVVINLHYLAPMIRRHLARRRRPDVVFSDESAGLLETGGGLKAALPLLGAGPVLLLNSDVWWRGDNPLENLAANWRPGMQALLLTVPAARPGGDFLLRPDRRLAWPGPDRAADVTFTGAQIAETALFAAEPARRFSTRIIWSRMIETGGLFAQPHSGEWVEAGDPAGLAAARDLAMRP